MRAAVEDGHIGAGHSIRQNAPEISRNAEVESLGVKSVAGYKDVEFSPRTARAGGDADGAGLRVNVGKRSARNVPVPVSGDGDDRRGHGGAVAQVSHFSRRRVHAKPTSADMPVGTGLIMAAGKGEAFYVACIPGAVVARGTAQYSQTRDRDIGAAKNSQNGPLVFAVSRPAGDSDEVGDLTHRCAVAVTRVEADFDLGVVRGMNGIGVGRRPRLAVTVNRHVVVGDDRIAAVGRREILHLSSRARDVESDRVAVVQHLDGLRQVGLAGAHGIIGGRDRDDGCVNRAGAGGDRARGQKTDEFLHDSSGKGLFSYGPTSLVPLYLCRARIN